MESRQTDAVLVACAKEGDLGAFDKLIARHRSRIYRLARYMVGETEAAQDIAQETFLQAFRSLPGLVEAESFGAWLNTIARRQAQRWQNQREHKLAQSGAIVTLGLYELRQPEAELPDALVLRLRGALQALSERERRVMIRHYLEGYSCAEIAVQLRLPVGTIKRILHYSRQKAHKESITMVAKEQESRGPRRLDHWMMGQPGEQFEQVSALFSTSLAESICLSINKTAKRAEQIGEEVQAHPKYVAEALAKLVEYEVVKPPQKERYLLNFIAFDGADWRRLMERISEPAAQVAARLREAQPRLQAAFAQTPLAGAGWAWSAVTWQIYAVIIGHFAATRHQPRDFWPAFPARWDGGRYWEGGYELVAGMQPSWNVGTANKFSEKDQFQYAKFQIYGVDPAIPKPEQDTTAVLGLLSHGPLEVEQILARLGEERDHWQEMIAKLIEFGLLRNAQGELQVAFPVFIEEDSAVLLGVVDELVEPLMNEVVLPIFADVDRLLDEMGYGHLRDQYPIWHLWLNSRIFGEAVRFLMEQGVLPKEHAPIPPAYGFIGWRGKVPLLEM